MKPTIFAIVGSAAGHSANLQLVRYLAAQTSADFNWIIFDRLRTLPHFNPELSLEHTPPEIVAFRENIQQADGLLICTPEYIFSLPAGLKNAIEWCVATTVFSQKPTGLITASASGQKGHEELMLIMKTVEAHFTPKSTLLIPGIKAKIDGNDTVTDTKTADELNLFIAAFKKLVRSKGVAS